MNVKDKDFKLLIDRIIEELDFPENALYVDEDDFPILFIGDEVSIVKPITNPDELHISFNLNTHPVFVANFIRLVESLDLVYDIYESFIYDEDGSTIFESEMDICPDYRKEQENN